ncbi:acid-sensing ion channel 1-like [Elysia marginata]|uniref:Acid-sensing ion channel 1-like n=1 Tax=Elysia marginata TaxID=1093978 RepID=A0AAV4JKK6_9GAST|nr:acid-sensing ion channel 1-like [Elysia marginata]
MSGKIYTSRTFSVHFSPENSSIGKATAHDAAASSTRVINGDGFLPTRKDASTQIAADVEQELEVVMANKNIPCTCQAMDESVTVGDLIRYYRESATIHGVARIKDKKFYVFRSWQLEHLPCEELFKPVQTNLGVCFTFNGRNQDNETTDLKKATSNWSMLRVLVDTQNDRSYFSKVIHAGVKVLVHEPEHTPYPEWKGWFLRPGVAASLAVARTETSRLPAPYKAYKNSYCADIRHEGYKNPLKRYKLYSHENCLSECLMDFMEGECGCLSYNAHFDGNYTVCSAKQTLACEIPNSAKIEFSDLQSCSCPRSCDQVAYDADVTYADFASMFIQEQALKDNITGLNDTLRRNVIDFRVFFKSLNVYEVRQEPKLTRETIIGTVGGQMGLFLGASILSITELAEVLLLVIARAVRHCALWVARRGKVHPASYDETGKIRGQTTESGGS